MKLFLAKTIFSLSKCIIIQTCNSNKKRSSVLAATNEQPKLKWHEYDVASSQSSGSAIDENKLWDSIQFNNRAHPGDSFVLCQRAADTLRAFLSRYRPTTFSEHFEGLFWSNCSFYRKISHRDWTIQSGTMHFYCFLCMLDNPLSFQLDTLVQERSKWNNIKIYLDILDCTANPCNFAFGWEDINF